MVVGYRMKPFTFWLQKIVKTPYVSLPNLLAGREIIKELLQEECTPEALARTITPLLTDAEKAQRKRNVWFTITLQLSVVVLMAKQANAV